MTKDTLKRIIVDQREDLEQLFRAEKPVSREGIPQCRKLLSHPNILLVSGPRRTGKSFFSHILAAERRYAFINFDDERLLGFSSEDFNQILECFYELYGDPEYLLFDEIQNIHGWELFISRLRQGHKIIVTGSNANLLSSEMASHLTGRFVPFSLFPMSFSEFILYKSFKVSPNDIHSTRKRAAIEALFAEYLRFGGIFEYYKFGKPHLRSLFSSIITKDILGRYKIGYPTVLEEMALTLITGFATKISTNKIAKQFKVKSYHTIQDYLAYIQNTYLVFSINKFSYKLKEQLSSFKKIYTIDNGFIEALAFNFSENKGRLLENLVAVELKRRCANKDTELFYWDNYLNECDFIIKTGKKVSVVYQVCYELNSQNEKREINGLLGALTAYNLGSGTILTMSQKESRHVAGRTISVLPVWEWLLLQL
ncbi:MAG: hypothetical protein A2268_13195 [Candidatus Raymondbacteria bacterium RifOxyA12_full_50_37]|uniref:AAA family ATPase n=1 Tax=Candidatus Raymondbacteria bacterium RIFOXYD12_FULL_49_13 TaxID=1817890 RepID=A0A1F7EZW3_UNCRA|nr:MAG: hypothetical protein A2268_13195 [Candidatus Raymondbacteria bacterium RifOxyA12_full_50_37]OGJ93017.1 MAG: hypothetical protein A2248_18330 [Candidatus Raymondbacteria bacterium RIFOXYA2_FULL_49_16]OGJ93591.1 MAG: hypothetical protein A2350_19095 [Candidatus Raymondbacteria bacterium RifOxyB12_full_50_8]OGJ99930.1 MAG: hypothetical protein A2519_00310 [Candidatus Raymondbacteria bacterium RIFOXYD12_FULL_49_13]OGK01560.1 MAG: hypothetical protein A2487_15570 [Candidatus Raymondbacteria 